MKHVTDGLKHGPCLTSAPCKKVGPFVLGPIQGRPGPAGGALDTLELDRGDFCSLPGDTSQGHPDPHCWRLNSRRFIQGPLPPAVEAVEAGTWLHRHHRTAPPLGWATLTAPSVTLSHLSRRSQKPAALQARGPSQRPGLASPPLRSPETPFPSSALAPLLHDLDPGWGLVSRVRAVTGPSHRGPSWSRFIM